MASFIWQLTRLVSVLRYWCAQRTLRFGFHDVIVGCAVRTRQ